jgi:chromosome segregation ATPase
VHQTVVEPETAVVKRARARATRTQLIADQIGLENRHRKLPDAVAKAEKEVCYSEKALADAERALADQRQAHENAVARLEALYDERDNAEAELAAISDELNKLAVLV